MIDFRVSLSLALAVTSGSCPTLTASLTAETREPPAAAVKTDDTTVACPFPPPKPERHGAKEPAAVRVACGGGAPVADDVAD